MDILRRSLQPNRRDKVINAEGTLISQVEEETSLGSVEDDTTALPVPATLLDTSIDASDADDVQYKFIDENVTTYRVVQFGDTVDSMNANAITSSTTLSGSPSGGSSPQSATIYTGPLNGVYVINSSDVFPVNERPKTITQVVAKSAPPSRDDKRRATHNEVERRRRDKINNWIVKLGKIMPECKSDSSKGSYEMHSKGGILAKACDYIKTNSCCLTFSRWGVNAKTCGEKTNNSAASWLNTASPTPSRQHHAPSQSRRHTILLRTVKYVLLVTHRTPITKILPPSSPRDV
ncbi:hypothetical protein GE061_018905 [Apolygus lucorum]|uniref:Uncharacterized protein n=1 Tax=Apolygus lucorum TaxID=248454 RepID=A0A6A4JQ54_APOLU|nr:hypothetical protein GE061_018905 [Apolygus lucorum]